LLYKTTSTRKWRTNLTKQLFKLTKESEEYLEAIYKLQKRKGIAKTTEIARKLNVALGSVTNTIKCLERKGLVEHEPYKGVRLTEKGVKEALRVIRKHRLAERLLVDALKMEWSKVHEAACSLEHAITEEMLPYMERALGYPKRCPHGNPIPSSEGEIIEEKCRPLSSLRAGKIVKIIKITEESSEILQILESYGIKPGKKMHLLDKDLGRGFVKVRVDKECCVLNSRLAAAIWVRGEDDERRRQ